MDQTTLFLGGNFSKKRHSPSAIISEESSDNVISGIKSSRQILIHKAEFDEHDARLQPVPSPLYQPRMMRRTTLMNVDESPSHRRLQNDNSDMTHLLVNDKSEKNVNFKLAFLRGDRILDGKSGDL
jgi:hypothetical protein